MQGGKNRKHADPVGDEVRRILGGDDPFAQRTDQKGFQRRQHIRVGSGAGNQLHQMHVARRVEEMHPAEAVVQGFIQNFRKRVDRKSGGIRSQNRLGTDKRQNLRVQGFLPVDSLGNGLDDQITAFQALEMIIVVGWLDVLNNGLGGQRSRGQFAQIGQCLADHGILVGTFGRQVEEDDRHASIGQMGGNLRTHDAGAEDGDFLETVIGHRNTPVIRL